MCVIHCAPQPRLQGMRRRIHVCHTFCPSTAALTEREKETESARARARERERALLGTIHNGGRAPLTAAVSYLND